MGFRANLDMKGFGPHVNNLISAFQSGELDRVKEEAPKGNETTAEDGSTIAANTLRYDEHKLIIERLTNVPKENTSGVTNILARGLGVPADIGQPIVGYEQVSDQNPASVAVYPTANQNKDRNLFGIKYVPLPVIWKDAEINFRTLSASSMRGQRLDVTNFMTAGKEVWIAANELLFNGWAESLEADVDNKMYGLTTTPGAMTVSITTGAWNGTVTSNAGSTIETEAINMIAANKTRHYRGPYVFYVSNNIDSRLDRVWNLQYGNETIRERLMRMEGVIAVELADQLDDDTVLLVQMDAETIQIAVASQLRNDEYQMHPFCHNYLVWAAIAPLVKTDINGRAGVVIGE